MVFGNTIRHDIRKLTDRVKECRAEAESLKDRAHQGEYYKRCVKAESLLNTAISYLEGRHG